MYDQLLSDLDLSSLLSDDLLGSLMSQLKTYLIVSGLVSLLILAGMIWLFAFYLPRKRKEQSEAILREQFSLLTKRIESQYALKLEELTQALREQTAQLTEAVDKLREMSARIGK